MESGTYSGLGDFVSVIVDAFTTTAGDVLLMFAQLLPIGLGIFGVAWGVRKGMSFFKKSTA